MKRKVKEENAKRILSLFQSQGQFLEITFLGSISKMPNFHCIRRVFLSFFSVRKCIQVKNIFYEIPNVMYYKKLEFHLSGISLLTVCVIVNMDVLLNLSIITFALSFTLRILPITWVIESRRSHQFSFDAIDCQYLDIQLGRNRNLLSCISVSQTIVSILTGIVIPLFGLIMDVLLNRLSI